MTDLPSMPRGLILPPEVPDFARDWWINTMQQVVKSPEWKQYLDENYLTRTSSGVTTSPPTWRRPPPSSRRR